MPTPLTTASTPNTQNRACLHPSPLPLPRILRKEHVYTPHHCQYPEYSEQSMPTPLTTTPNTQNRACLHPSPLPLPRILRKEHVYTPHHCQYPEYSEQSMPTPLTTATTPNTQKRACLHPSPLPQYCGSDITPGMVNSRELKVARKCRDATHTKLASRPGYEARSSYESLLMSKLLHVHVVSLHGCCIC